MSEIKQPEDRKPKKVTTFPFTDGEGKEFVLPLASVGRSRLTGRDVRDAAIGGEAGQLGYLFKALEASDPDAAALEAIYDMPQDDAIEILGNWAEFGDGDGASLGK